MKSIVNHFDLLVLGAGSGGIASGRWAAGKLGISVGIIEHQKLGGTCVNVGCVPKKVMFNAASFLDDLKMMGSYSQFSLGEQNIDLSQISLDFNGLVEKREKYITRLNGIYKTLLDTNNVTHINGWGKFVDSKTIEVGGVNYTADHIIIATGSKPVEGLFEG